MFVEIIQHVIGQRHWSKSNQKLKKSKAKDIDFRDFNRSALVQDSNDNETKRYESRTLIIRKQNCSKQTQDV